MVYQNGKLIKYMGTGVFIYFLCKMCRWKRHNIILKKAEMPALMGLVGFLKKPKKNKIAKKSQYLLF